MRSRLLLVAGVVVAATACVLTLAGAVWLRSAPARQLAAAQQRWAARPFSAYRLVVDVHAFGSCHYDVEVRDEQVVKIFQRSCLQPAPTVTDLFRVVGASLQEQECGPNGCGCDGPIGVDAAYDAQLGYPTNLAARIKPEYRWRYLDYWKRQFLGGGCTLIGWVGERRQVLSLTPIP
jgi:Family of unknown function (DUF6174)